jgi:hypothetical protein
MRRKIMYVSASEGRTEMANTPRSFTSPIPSPQKIERNIATRRTITVMKMCPRNVKVLTSIVIRDVIPSIESARFGMR